MQNLLSKLNGINFTSYNDKKLTSDDGFAVSYSVNLNETSGICDCIFQVVVRVTYNDALVTHYGCVTIEETNEFGKWFLLNKNKAYNNEYAKKRQFEDIGKTIFNRL